MIGINTAINAQGQGSLRDSNHPSQEDAAGSEKARRVLRGWLGAPLVEHARRVYVDGIVLRSGAFKAGLKSGDRVVEVDGKAIDEQLEWSARSRISAGRCDHFLSGARWPARAAPANL